MKILLRRIALKNRGLVLNFIKKTFQCLKILQMWEDVGWLTGFVASCGEKLNSFQ